MELRELTPKQVTEIYNSAMQKDFDPAELKPLGDILALMKRDVYPCLGFYEKDTLVAYALFCDVPDKKGYLLLDYYAVDSSLRGYGYGSSCITMMKEYLSEMGYQGIIAEVERVHRSDYAPGSPDDWRQRRIAFYERCGLRHTSIWCTLFGVDFVIMTLDFVSPLTDCEVMARMEALYHLMLTPEKYHENVHLYYK